MLDDVTAERLATLTIRQIAALIRADWPKPHYAARPYLEAMLSLETMADSHLADTAHYIVNGFLCNAASYRGPIARAVKAELRLRAQPNTREPRRAASR